MPRFKAIFFANGMVLLHAVVLYILFFGWLFTRFEWLYIFTIVLTLSTQIYFGYCILVKWEFDFRKKIDPTLSYDYSFLSWYAYKYSKVQIPVQLMKWISYVFLSASLVAYLTRYAIFY